MYSLLLILFTGVTLFSLLLYLAFSGYMKKYVHRQVRVVGDENAALVQTTRLRMIRISYFISTLILIIASYCMVIFYYG